MPLRGGENRGRLMCKMRLAHECDTLAESVDRVNQVGLNNSGMSSVQRMAPILSMLDPSLELGCGRVVAENGRGQLNGVRQEYSWISPPAAADALVASGGTSLPSTGTAASAGGVLASGRTGEAYPPPSVAGMDWNVKSSIYSSLGTESSVVDWICSSTVCPT